ncbi:MAG: hypothetical protein GY832_44210 [Chloroflexi bacterium]|nr:hypothetical protein [Chloroflexota bacterium]
MKIKLHRSNRNLWIVAMVLFVVGIVGSFVSIPLLSAAAFYLVALSAALLLLGTWVF